MQALWMLLGAAFFATMGVCVKYGSDYYNYAELVFYRGVVGVFILLVIARQQRVSLRTHYVGMHLWRSAIGVLSLSAWFYAIANLPLATAMTLNYMSGVWVAAFIVGGSLLYGGQEKQGALLATVLMGFAGVVMTLHPTIEKDQLFAGVVGLLSGISAALAYMQVTALGKAGEPETRTVFYFSLGTIAVGAISLPLGKHTDWTTLRWQEAAWIIPIGVLASLGQLAMTRAYRKGATLVVASMQYSGIVFAALFGALLMDEQIEPLGWAGMAVIVASGLIATYLRTRALPDTPAEAH
jgi:S-adenosylmethionine uptake transporter